MEDDEIDTILEDVMSDVESEDGDSSSEDGADIVDQLERLAALNERGVLSDAELEQAKGILLGTQNSSDGSGEDESDRETAAAIDSGVSASNEFMRFSLLGFDYYTSDGTPGQEHLICAFEVENLSEYGLKLDSEEIVANSSDGFSYSGIDRHDSDLISHIYRESSLSGAWKAYDPEVRSGGKIRWVTHFKIDPGATVVEFDYSVMGVSLLTISPEVAEQDSDLVFSQISLRLALSEEIAQSGVKLPSALAETVSSRGFTSR